MEVIFGDLPFVFIQVDSGHVFRNRFHDLVFPMCPLRHSLTELIFVGSGLSQISLPQSLRVAEELAWEDYVQIKPEMDQLLRKEDV